MTNNFTPPKQNTGNVYKNRYKDNDRKPDWTGKIEVSKEFLKDLVSKYKPSAIVKFVNNTGRFEDKYICYYIE